MPKSKLTTAIIWFQFDSTFLKTKMLCQINNCVHKCKCFYMPKKNVHRIPRSVHATAIKSSVCVCVRVSTMKLSDTPHVATASHFAATQTVVICVDQIRVLSVECIARRIKCGPRSNKAPRALCNNPGSGRLGWRLQRAAPSPILKRAALMRPLLRALHMHAARRRHALQQWQIARRLS
jgi:hypothetical protein